MRASYQRPAWSHGSADGPQVLEVRRRRLGHVRPPSRGTARRRVSTRPARGGGRRGRRRVGAERLELRAVGGHGVLLGRPGARRAPASSSGLGRAVDERPRGRLPRASARCGAAHGTASGDGDVVGVAVAARRADHEVAGSSDRVDRGGDVGDVVGAALVGRAEAVQGHLRDAEPGQRLGALGGPAVAQASGARRRRAGVRGLAVGHGDDDDLAALLAVQRISPPAARISSSGCGATTTRRASRRGGPVQPSRRPPVVGRIDLHGLRRRGRGAAGRGRR